ncbi:YbjQ family protein [Halorussus halophilus]|uniref:YbjQ family protein n=1 Tax=Halorussus halophilus TaxID=2650975 RepID=UPI001300E96B|nr:heavy metal-binding domain-containing protein [Halorussus halophilus]
MIVTNTETVTGREITENLGLVRGNTVRARNVGRDITQGLRNIAGGELKAYTTLLSDAREQAIGRMQAEAEELEADAIVNVRFVTAEVTNGGAELLAYGTAVRLAPREE